MPKTLRKENKEWKRTNTSYWKDRSSMEQDTLANPGSLNDRPFWTGCVNEFTVQTERHSNSKSRRNLNSHAHNMGVSENSGTPKSSILIGLSIINYPFWGYHCWKHPYHFIWWINTCPLYIPEISTQQPPNPQGWFKALLWYDVYIKHNPNTKQFLICGLSIYILSMCTSHTYDKLHTIHPWTTTMTTEKKKHHFWLETYIFKRLFFCHCHVRFSGVYIFVKLPHQQPTNDSDQPRYTSLTPQVLRPCTGAT